MGWRPISSHRPLRLPLRTFCLRAYTTLVNIGSNRFFREKKNDFFWVGRAHNYHDQYRTKTSSLFNREPLPPSKLAPVIFTSATGVRVEREHETLLREFMATLTRAPPTPVSSINITYTCLRHDGTIDNTDGNRTPQWGLLTKDAEDRVYAGAMGHPSLAYRRPGPAGRTSGLLLMSRWGASRTWGLWRTANQARSLRCIITPRRTSWVIAHACRRSGVASSRREMTLTSRIWKVARRTWDRRRSTDCDTLGFRAWGSQLWEQEPYIEEGACAGTGQGLCF